MLRIGDGRSILTGTTSERFMSEGFKPATTACATCARPLAGRYCSQCGEEALDLHALTIRHFIAHTLVHETLHLDGKIWRTLRCLLFRPGFLAAEYCAGRHRPYVNPVRILITAIIAYALLTHGGLRFALQIRGVSLSLTPTATPEGASIEDTVSRLDRFGMLASLFAARSKAVELSSESAAARFHAALEKFSEPLSFANGLLLALALFAIFHRRRPLLVAHGVFSIHLVSFVLFSSLLILPALALLQHGHNTPAGIILIAVILWQMIYLAMAIRRFYFATDLRGLRPALLATATALLVYALNSAFVTGIQLVGGAMALWSV
jgi:hypothetical protein